MVFKGFFSAVFIFSVFISGMQSAMANQPNVVAECSDNKGKNITGLAEACYDVCNHPKDLTFLTKERLRECQKILVRDKGQRKNTQTLVAQLSEKKKKAESSLGRCIKLVSGMESLKARIERRVSEFKRRLGRRQDGKKLSEAIRKRIEARIEELRASFPEFPKCVPSSQALLRLYECLEEEATSITASYNELEKKGYRNKNLKICSITGVVDDSIEAENISHLFSGLRAQFRLADKCKRDVVKWNQERQEKACGKNSSTECSNRIQRYINKTNEDLKPVQQRASKVGRNLDALNENLENIYEIIQQVIVECE